MGTYNKYSIEDIKKGDLVYFDDTPMQSNYDEYWEVCEIHPFNGEVIVKLNYLFEDHYRNIHCTDIRQTLQINRVSQTG